MFKRSRARLEDCAAQLQLLMGSRSPVMLESTYAAFWKEAARVLHTLGTEGRELPDFELWYSQKLREMDEDPLLQYARVASSREADPQSPLLLFPAAQVEPASGDEDFNILRGAKFVLEDGGPFWLVGKRHRRRVPIRHGYATVKVAVRNAPLWHQGEPIASLDPLTLCRLTLAYLSDLVLEASRSFPPRQSQ